MNRNQLWNSILQQAISGKLVAQLDSEPEVKQVGPAPKPEEVPFELPPKWKWVQLNTVTEYSPDIQADDNLDVSFTPLEDLSFGFKTELTFNQIKSWSKVKKGYKRYQDGDVIFAKITPSFQNRKSGLVVNAHNGIGCGSTEFCVYRCKELLLNKYLLWFFKSEHFINFGKNTFKGTAGQQRVNLDLINSMYLPLPPVEEQRRIVARLEEIRPLVDKFGETQDKLVKLEADFPSKLKASVLQQAIKGLLVPQLDSEPEVEQLGPAPKPDEVPFELPPKWKWVQLTNLSSKSFSGGTPSKANPEYWGGDIPWASIKDLSPASEELLTTQDYITELGLQESSSKLVETGNVIVGMRMGLDKIAINRIRVAINQDLRGLYLDPELIIPEYFVKFYKTLKLEGAGTTVKGIKANQLLATWIPLPPLGEQRRIVAKIEEVFEGVKQLGSLMEYA